MRFPTMRVWHKDSKTNKNTNLGAIWESEQYPNSFTLSLGEYDKESRRTDPVVAIKLESGKILQLGKGVGYLNGALSDGLSVVNSPSQEGGPFDDGDNINF